MRIVVTCGGTGGHVFPGVAAALAMQAKGHEVALLLSGRNVEGEAPAGWRGEVLRVAIPRLSWRRPASFFLMVRACFASVAVLRRFRPAVLLGMGSYTSFPPVLAARLLRTPVVLHEANAIPGKAVSALSRLAVKACIAFDDAARRLPQSVAVENTGLPVRPGIVGAAPGEFADPSRFTVLVMGGSQGSRAVNQAVAGAVAILDSEPEQAAALRVIHLAGRGNEDAVKAAYATVRNIPVEVIGFSERMGALYAAADFCISRAGAASCFELCLCGVPALLIPLPKLANDHQTANAKAMQALGACEMMAQDTATPEAVAAVIRRIRGDEAARAAMRETLLARARPDAADALARVVIACAKGASETPAHA
ncbi:MAG: UDP-N-acetylglucosamine--N-acetylmuramyl-(pentapeptide) pyrophosphoryl-undecaprenol N-acetylglucosamine transferase [Kiritimatiellia bacterium]|jgi:UDP-N-acetylglucosamine--N-acetylmuramyl-(pentapeptide) pyrophosphoryl-undecaprenol N-acetylglucosamine transferase